MVGRGTQKSRLFLGRIGWIQKSSFFDSFWPVNQRTPIVQDLKSCWPRINTTVIFWVVFLQWMKTLHKTSGFPSHVWWHPSSQGSNLCYSHDSFDFSEAGETGFVWIIFRRGKFAGKLHESMLRKGITERAASLGYFKWCSNHAVYHKTI
jgi:hypothetical protein